MAGPVLRHLSGKTPREAGGVLMDLRVLTHKFEKCTIAAHSRLKAQKETRGLAI